MQVTSLLSRKHRSHEHPDHHDHNHQAGEGSCAGCEQDHSHAPIRLWQTLAGLLFTANSYIVGWLNLGPAIADVSGMIGAILLGYPIALTAITGLRRGLLSTNELVAVAVLASFASGHYQ